MAGDFDAERRVLTIRSGDVKTALRDLVGWADQNHLDLSELEIGPPSLEDAYLAITGAQSGTEPHHD
jgi:hypothetical protein